MSIAINLAERGLVPDFLIRRGIRSLLKERIGSISAEPKSDKQWVAELSQRELAEDTDAANDQHYEIPAPYFRTVLGENLKYSCGLWPDNVNDLDQSEAEMLELSCERAELEDGQNVLELGCGWGSLSLWMAKDYPNSSITSISNSNSQREYIESQAELRGLANLKVITCDINEFEPDSQFDRLVSVEMFEHVRNHKRLFNQIHGWLKPGGKCFVHIFTHHRNTYLFDAKSSKDWMSRYFFTGGIMPSATHLIEASSGSLECEANWEVNGVHYSKTLEAWLEKQDANRESIMNTFKECYGASLAKLWYQRWRIFYMACSELFAYNEGKEWPVMHYRFAKPN